VIYVEELLTTSTGLTLTSDGRQPAVNDRSASAWERRGRGQFLLDVALAS
jgi:hypothetical protein